MLAQPLLVADRIGETCCISQLIDLSTGVQLVFRELCLKMIDCQSADSRMSAQPFFSRSEWTTYHFIALSFLPNRIGRKLWEELCCEMFSIR